MMNEFTIGSYVVATAGHDSGKYYVIISMDQEYVYLVDGRIRTLERPKRKKPIHIRMLSEFDPSLAVKVQNKTAKNEEIKRAIKLVNNEISSKEVE
jgi:ribosomal protein L14E/L6E/L27E